MALEAAKAAHLGQPRIVIHAHFQIGITHPFPLEIELISEAEHTRVGARLDRREKEITVRAGARYRTRDDRTHVAHQPSQTHEIALVQRHETHEAPGAGSPRRSAPLIRDHATTIPCRYVVSGPQSSLDTRAVEDPA